MAKGGGVVEFLLRVRDEGSAALNRTSESAKGTARSLDRAKTQALATGRALGKMSVAALAAGAAIGKLAQHNADLINQMVDASTRTGIQAETLNGLRLAAEGSGLQFSNLERTLQGFVLRVSQASAGMGEAKRGLEQLGVSVNDSGGELRSLDEILRDVLNALSAIEDPTKRAAAAAEIFGASGGKLLQALGDPGALQDFVDLAEQFGTSVGPDAAKAAGDWQRSMADLKTVMSGTLQGVSRTLFGDGGLVAKIDSFNLGLVATGRFMEIYFKRVKESFAEMMTGLKALLDLDFEGFFASEARTAERFRQEGFGIAASWQEAKQEALEYWTLVNAIRDGGGVSGTGTGGGGVAGTGTGTGGGDGAGGGGEIVFRTEVTGPTRLEGVQREEDFAAAVAGLAPPSRGPAPSLEDAERLAMQRDSLISMVVRNTAGLTEGRLPGLTWFGQVVNFLAAIGGDDVQLDWHELQETIEDAIAGALELYGSMKDFGIAIADGIIFGLIDVIPQIVQGVIDGFTKDVKPSESPGEAHINEFFRGLGIPGFQTGTRYVDRTGLALIHQGEHVVPANGALPQRAFGGGGLNVTIQTGPFGLQPGAAEQFVRELNRVLGGRGLNLSVT